MTQNRKPPAFQEYAASMLADIRFRVLTMAQRGLLSTMRLECWVNNRLPENPAALARVLGFEMAEVTRALPAVMPFFATESGAIICPELENYRAHLEGIRAKQAAGGKQGAAVTNGKRQGKGTSTAEPDNSQVTRGSTRESLVQSSSVQSNQTQSLERGEYSAEQAEWVTDYERASNGG